MITPENNCAFTLYDTRAAVGTATDLAVDEVVRNTIYRAIITATDPVTSTTYIATRNGIWAAIDPISR